MDSSQNGVDEKDGFLFGPEFEFRYRFKEIYSLPNVISRKRSFCLG